jgi:hypothetical protein
MNDELSAKDVQAIRRGFERASQHGWGLALGILAAMGLFLATAVLVVKGGPDPGPHLGLLSEYFPGYRVTWLGAFVGACYGFFLGYGAGRTIGAVYNLIIEHS